MQANTPGPCSLSMAMQVHGDGVANWRGMVRLAGESLVPPPVMVSATCMQVAAALSLENGPFDPVGQGLGILRR